MSDVKKKAKNGVVYNTIQKLKRHQFLFEELVKRDFKQKYKRTVLGMMWSVLSPLLHLLVMRLVFTNFFGRTLPHYTTYLFIGNIVFSFFREATTNGMNALVGNARIFTKINVPKYLFLLSKNVSSIINFGLTLIVFVIFAMFDGIRFSWSMLLFPYPIVCLIVMNIGIGLILSAMYVFFRDVQYLYDIFTLLLMYMSAIFYSVEAYPAAVQNLFYINPLYCYITYLRTIVIDGSVPSLLLHGLVLGYALLFAVIGGLMYKKKNHKFLYYV